MNFTLCPLCVIEHRREFGDEPHNFVVDQIKFTTCEEHKNNRNIAVYAEATTLLREAHEDCPCVTGVIE